MIRIRIAVQDEIKAILCTLTADGFESKGLVKF